MAARVQIVPGMIISDHNGSMMLVLDVFSPDRDVQYCTILNPDGSAWVHLVATIQRLMSKLLYVQA